MRVIDASRFGEIMEQWKKDCLEANDQQSADVIADVILQLDDMPTLTPPNEWVSVGDEIPSDDDDGLEFFCMTNATGKCGGVLPMEWEVATIRGKTVRRWKWRSRISPWAVTHWMKRPAPPGENNNVPTKATNEPLSLEQLREMEGEPVWIVDVGPHKWYGPGWAIVDRDNCLVRTVKNWNPVFFERYGERWIAYRRPPEGEVDGK